MPNIGELDEVFAVAKLLADNSVITIEFGNNVFTANNGKIFKNNSPLLDSRTLQQSLIKKPSLPQILQLNKTNNGNKLKEDFKINNATYATVKSLTGKEPTLLNASHQTRALFNISPNLPNNIITTLNQIEKISDRLKAISQHPAKISFIEFAEKKISINLNGIDSDLSTVLLNKVCDGKLNTPQQTKIPVLYKAEIEKNKNAIQELLYRTILGFTFMGGNYCQNITSIYLVRNNSLYCFDLNKQDHVLDLKEYLYQNSYIDTPSTKRHKYGFVYSNLNTNKSQIDLCFQLRLKTSLPDERFLI